ncbi:MAG: GHKL domain-containing protein [Chryseobacterium sp.]|nr:GHKL domain-containing protein [Chryseobacterium sp.]
MKFHQLTFYASLFLTGVMMLVAFIFDLSKSSIQKMETGMAATFLASILAMIVINYFVLDFLFNFYGKKQISRIRTILPQEMMGQEEGMNFTQLGERVSEMSQKKATELDTMKEMETYRKEYIGNISHELKTPLFTIQGYVETLMDGAVENLAVRDKYLSRIDTSVERLLDIVKDLDMINQFESGEIDLNITEFDINILVREMIDLLDLEAQKINAKMQLQATQQQIFVKADRQRISQVLVNLISNAIHYANRDNALIQVIIKPMNHKVLIEIKDNGMGIKPEALPRIFERFYRVESSRNRRDGGSGLGLAIVKHILEAHHENIEVHSVYLEGTTFSFTLEKGE